MKVYIYPADDVIGGTIEAAEAVHWTDRKALFSRRTSNGNLGAKLSSVYITEQQAENARKYDIIRLESINVHI